MLASAAAGESAQTVREIHTADRRTISGESRICLLRPGDLQPQVRGLICVRAACSELQESGKV